MALSLCSTTALCTVSSDYNARPERKINCYRYRPTVNNARVVAATVRAQSRKSCADSAYMEVRKKARSKFCEEVSLRKKDEDISLAKTVLFIAAEDEALMSFNRDVDACFVLNEHTEHPNSSKTHLDLASIDDYPLADKSLSDWLFELDTISKQVEVELVSKEIGCNLVQVLDAVNTVLFELRGFTRSAVLANPKGSYLHRVLSSSSGSGIMLSIIYMEVCKKLGVTIFGARVGEEFLIWPQAGNAEELFKCSQGQCWFAKVNGKCVQDPQSKASDLNSRTLLELEVASNREIVGISLANLKRLYWKRASKAHPGLLLTAPLRSVCHSPDLPREVDSSNVALLHPEELRLATMASERLLILQPHSWILRRDHGMLLFYSRRYGEAVQELSICMALAPVEEARVLAHFVEKLHLMRLESSWKSVGLPGALTSI